MAQQMSQKHQHPPDRPSSSRLGGWIHPLLLPTSGLTQMHVCRLEAIKAPLWMPSQLKLHLFLAAIRFLIFIYLC